jgi:hypothetical protein
MTLAVEGTQRRIYDGLQRATADAASQPAYALLARYNPSRADLSSAPAGGASPCAPFEARFQGRWHRVILAGSSDALAALSLYADQARGPQPPALILIASPTARAERCPNTRQWVQVLQVQAVNPWLNGQYP